MLRLALALTVGLAACTDKTEDEVRAAVTLLLHEEGSHITAAADRLARLGRPAIPTIESAMHTATPTGKKNLVLALRKIADPDAVPLVLHIATHDRNPDVRREAEWTLRQWAQSGAPALAAAAAKAVRQLDEAQGKEEAG